uniref:Uncharacterized protein n=1 Tax=Solanum tuberosum TaxID=4113 RepID=M1DXM3_SOLTU
MDNPSSDLRTHHNLEISNLTLLQGRRVNLELICVNKLVGHPYFTRSKAPKDSFPDQSLLKGKAVIGDNNDEISLTDVVVAQPAAADQNELIMQLMQQIAEMRIEMQRRQDLRNLGFAFNAPADVRPPLHFPPSNAKQAQNQPSNPAQNPRIIDLTASNPHHASISYQAPPPPQGEVIENWFKEGDIVLEEMIETPVILDSEPKEQMPNWTSTPLLIPRSPW